MTGVQTCALPIWLTVGARYAAFGMILWQTLPYAPDSPDRKAALDWLAARLDSQRAWWGEAPPGAQVGNLRAWAALAAAALSVQTNRTGLRDWAAASLIEVLCTANPDGSLPQEMSRDKFALHYQLHAVAPLVTAAALLERQGVDVRDTCGGALHRVAGFAAADLTGGAKTKAITGVRQSFFDGTETLDPFQLAWIEPYLALWDDPAMDALAKPLRPLSYSKLGGDQTLIWGR